MCSKEHKTLANIFKSFLVTPEELGSGAIAAPWVAVEGFGTMDLKVTTFDAVLYEGASRGIPTTKLPSMYSRKLAAGVAVGAGQSNLYVCALPRDIDVRHIALTSATHRPHNTQQVSAIRPETSSKKQWHGGTSSPG